MFSFIKTVIRLNLELKYCFNILQHLHPNISYIILHIFASIKCSNRKKILEIFNIEYCPLINFHYVFTINHQCQLHLFNLKGKLRRKFKTWLQHKSNCLLHSELHKSSFKKVYFINLLCFLRILKYSYGSL